MPNSAEIAEISGSFLGRMLFKFYLMCMLFAASFIGIFNYNALQNNSTAGVLGKDSVGATAEVVIGSLGMVMSIISLFIIIAVDINGSNALRDLVGVYQGQEFCYNKDSKVALTTNSPSRAQAGGVAMDHDAMFDAPGVFGR